MQSAFSWCSQKISSYRQKNWGTAQFTQNYTLSLLAGPYFLKLNPASCPMGHYSKGKIMPLYSVVPSCFLKMLALLVVTSRCCWGASVLKLRSLVLLSLLMLKGIPFIAGLLLQIWGGLTGSISLFPRKEHSFGQVQMCHYVYAVPVWYWKLSWEIVLLVDDPAVTF